MHVEAVWSDDDKRSVIKQCTQLELFVSHALILVGRPTRDGSMAGLLCFCFAIGAMLAIGATP